MTIGLVGRKRGMTRVFTDAGESVPVTVIEALPNRVVRVKEGDRDGYRAIQVTVGSRRASRLSKPVAGHFARNGVEPGDTTLEFRLADGEGAELKSGSELKVDLFSAGNILVPLTPGTNEFRFGRPAWAEPRSRAEKCPATVQAASRPNASQRLIDRRQMSSATAGGISRNCKGRPVLRSTSGDASHSSQPSS